jgi:hypothetical protein
MSFLSPITVSLSFEFILREDQRLVVSRKSFLYLLILMVNALGWFETPITVSWLKNRNI